MAANTNSHFSSSAPPTVPNVADLNLGAEQVAAAARNPELMQQMVTSALDNVTVDDVNRQRQNLQGAQGQKVIAALRKQGIKPADLRKQILGSKSARGQEIHKMMQEAPLVVVIRSNKLLSKHIMPGAEEEFIRKATGSDPVMSACTKLSSDGCTIFVCSEAVGRRNKRASKLVGYDVCGEVLFGRKEGSLTLEAFAELEKIHSTTTMV